MKPLLFSFHGNERLAKRLSEQTGIPTGGLEIRQFPDGETFVKVTSDPAGCRAIVLCSLDRPDHKLLPLYFTCRTLKELGAQRVELVAPYLAYMRQDKRFHPGEAITSNAFAALLSGFADRLITVDPHLHRHHSLSEIYSIPGCVVHSAPAIAQWIRYNVRNPLLIGPDEESHQWVEAVAKTAGAPFEVLRKERRGDRDVEIFIPDVNRYEAHTPVLVDDIVSTAHTMIETIRGLQRLRMKAPVCIGVHAVFAGNAYAELRVAGAGDIITCNTITHPSNRIDLSHAISTVL